MLCGWLRLLRGEHAAQDRFNLTFAPGLVDALAQHIRSQHGSEISQHNGGAVLGYERYKNEFDPTDASNQKQTFGI